MVEVALAKQVARLLADPVGNERTAQSVASLLQLLPPVVRRGARPEPEPVNLDELCAEDRPFDMSLLDDGQLDALIELTPSAEGVRLR